LGRSGPVSAKSSVRCRSFYVCQRSGRRKPAQAFGIQVPGPTISLPHYNLRPEHLPFDERPRRLPKLREDGLISEPEYQAAKKKKILDEA